MSFDLNPPNNFNAAPPAKSDDTGKCCLIVAAVIIGAPALLIGLVFASSAWFGDKSIDDQAHAIVACESEVRDNLKSPSSAEFRSGAVESEGRWTVAGTVDAENSFGAKIRNRFECSVAISGDYASATITNWR